MRDALANPMLPTVMLLTVMLLTLAALTALATALACAWATRGLRRAAEVARAEARTDSLTGRPNRRALDAALRTPDADRALLFADLDAFKAVNDARGHAAGDALLTAVADAWPLDAFIARYGGDEFVALAASDDAVALARAMIAATRAATAGAVTLSVGLATGDPATALLRADRALARAKQAGGDRLAIDRPNLVRVRDAA